MFAGIFEPFGPPLLAEGFEGLNLLEFSEFHPYKKIVVLDLIINEVVLFVEVVIVLGILALGLFLVLDFYFDRLLERVLVLGLGPLRNLLSLIKIVQNDLLDSFEGLLLLLVRGRLTLKVVQMLQNFDPRLTVQPLELLL